MSDQRTPQDHAELFSRYSWVRKRHRLDERRRRFMRVPWAGGAVLMLCVAAAMLLANLPSTAMYYEHVLSTDLSLLIESPDHVVDLVFPRDMNVEKLINDGLMVIFFFVVGLEIKREIVCGELSTARKAILPVMAAAGGMLAPALIYLAFNHGTAGRATAGEYPRPPTSPSPSASSRCMGDRVARLAQNLPHGAGRRRRPGRHPGHRASSTAVTVQMRLPAPRAGHHGSGSTALKPSGRDADVLLFPGPGLRGVGTVLLFGRPLRRISGVAMALLIPDAARVTASPYFARQLRWLHPVAGCARARAPTSVFPTPSSAIYLRRMHDLSATTPIGMSYRLEHLPWLPTSPSSSCPSSRWPTPASRIDLVRIPRYLPPFARGSEPIGMGVFFGYCSSASRLESSSRRWAAVKSGLAEMPGGVSWRMLLAVACLGGIGFHDVDLRRRAGFRRGVLRQSGQDRHSVGLARLGPARGAADPCHDACGKELKRPTI